MTEFYSVKPNNAQHLDASNSGSNYIRYGEQAVDSSSKLIGHIIGQVDVWCARSNTSVSGQVTVNIRDSNDNIVCTIGSLDISTVPQVSEFPSNPVTFGPITTNTHAITVGDKILVEYDSGNSSNYLRVGEDTNAPYDSGVHSYDVYYQGGKYSRLTPSRDWAANFWDQVGGAPPPPGPAPPSPPPPPTPLPPPPPPTVGYVTNKRQA